MRARLLTRSALAVSASITLLVGAAAPVLAAPGPSAPEPIAAVPAAPSGVDDFTFDSFDATYELGRDGDGRSTLRTIEHLVAVFPDFDQNRGIKRALVNVYDGHRTGIQIVSVTDENGAPRDYDVAVEGEFTVLTIAVPEGQFVHGAQHYVIEYTQRDVTRYFDDTGDDEFYWDTNGTGWAQPFGSVTATVTVADDLVPAITAGESCYYGPEGSTAQCTITRDGGSFEASVDDLPPYSNMTVVVPFRPGTFAKAPFDLFAYLPIPVVIGIALLLASIVAAFVLRFAIWRPSRGRGIVIAQYEPPEGVSALLAANLVGKKRRGFAATLVDLAVRRKLRIVERDGGWGGNQFGVQHLDDSGLGPHEQAAMTALFATSFASFIPGLQSLAAFGGQPAVVAGGPDVTWLRKRDTTLGRQVVNLTKAVGLDAVRLGLRRKPPALPIVLIAIAAIVGTALVFIGGFLINGDLGIAISVIGINAAIWIVIGIIGMLAAHRPLTRAGAELREHLLGLREYIDLAEADRLQMLQSVTGAERISGAGGGDVVKIYERLLPYAVLFGLEKEWAAELGKYYDENPPDWYSGTSGFQVAAFSSGIGSLSSSVSTSYSGSSNSSSSGGSGGGGSSGGGGGGGGGGGV